MASSDAVVTAVASALSIVGSSVVIVSYLLARRKSNPKAARLVLYLSTCDFIWFVTAFVLSMHWLAGQDVNANACRLLGPLVLLSRIASIMWTSVIAWDVLQSVQRRQWKLGKKAKKWERRYFGLIFFVACPSAALLIIKQDVENDGTYGCGQGYEALGKWWVIALTELLPIVLAFLFNIWVATILRAKMSGAFPHSVRKRRRKMLYQIVVVGVFCWLPTIVHYVVTFFGHSPHILVVVARATLYSSGLFNCLVFGLNDPHLKRSSKMCLRFLGCDECFFWDVSPDLRHRSVDKIVMFEEATITPNANIPKKAKDIYRYGRLSKKDKIKLYKQRPDLFMTAPLMPPGEEEEDSDDRNGTDAPADASNDPQSASDSHSSEEGAAAAPAAPAAEEEEEEDEQSVVSEARDSLVSARARRKQQERHDHHGAHDAQSHRLLTGPGDVESPPQVSHKAPRRHSPRGSGGHAADEELGYQHAHAPQQRYVRFDPLADEDADLAAGLGTEFDIQFDAQLAAQAAANGDEEARLLYNVLIQNDDAVLVQHGDRFQNATGDERDSSASETLLSHPDYQALLGNGHGDVSGGVADVLMGGGAAAANNGQRHRANSFSSEESSSSSSEDDEDSSVTSSEDEAGTRANGNSHFHHHHRPHHQSLQQHQPRRAPPAAYQPGGGARAVSHVAPIAGYQPPTFMERHSDQPPFGTGGSYRQPAAAPQSGHTSPPIDAELAPASRQAPGTA